MWFSYRSEETWVPLHVSRVNQIIEMNKRNEYPEDLSEIIIQPRIVEKVLDYEHVVGQDSLTRLDERNRKKKKNNNSNRNKNRPAGGNNNSNRRNNNRPPQNKPNNNNN